MDLWSRTALRRVCRSLAAAGCLALAPAYAADTPRSIIYLQGTAFRDGQAAGSITPQSIRDLIATTQSRTPGIRVTDPEYGAKGDTTADHPTVTISGGSNALNIGTADFSPSVVGMHISVDGAGATSTTGYVSSVPVTAAGSGYTSVPTVTLGNVGSGTLSIPMAQMALQSSTVVGGGAGCTNGSQTFTLDTTTPSDGSRALTFATVSGTVSGGILSGSLTVVAAGTYIALPTTVTSVSLQGGGCTSPPTVNASFGVGAIYVTMGSGYTSGVTASISGGSPGSAATLGTPVITFPVAPLSTTITAYTDANDVTLANNAGTAVAGIQQTVSWGHDDTPAFTAAINAANAAAGNLGPSRYTIKVPAGDYTITSALPLLSSNVSLSGDGVNISKVRIDSAVSGTMFSWSDAWSGNSFVGSTVYPNSKVSPSLVGLHIIGNRNSPNTQNAVACFDHCDMLTLDRLEIDKVPGRAIWLGATLNDTAAYTRESHFTNVRMFSDGAPGVAVFDIATNSTGDTTNTDYISGIDIYSPFGPAIWIHGIGGAPRGIIGEYIRVEGLETGGVAADLIQIGDTTNNVAIHGVDLRHLLLIDPYEGFAGVHVTAPSVTFQAYNLYLDGGVSGTLDAGKGVQVDFARSSVFHFPGISTIDTGVTVAANAGGPLSINDDNLASSSWTWKIDSSELNLVGFPLYCAGKHTNTVGSSSLLTCGNSDVNTGIGSVALGISQQVSASNSLVFGTGDVATGGAQNYVMAHNTTTHGSIVGFTGQYGNDFSRFGWFGIGAGTLGSVAGKSQAGSQIIGHTTSGSTPATLTADGSAAGSANTVNLPANSAYGFGRLVVTAFDSVNTHACMFYVDGLLVRRGSTAATTSLVGTPTVTQSQCDAALAATTLGVTADTTNGGVTFTATGPIGINMDVTAEARSVEVQ